MGIRTRALVSWSSGKDAAWTLHELRRSPDIDVVGLLTTVAGDEQRVTMHRVPVALLEAQARAVGMPLWKVPIPDPCPNDAYEAAMRRLLDDVRREDIRVIAFGDLFLDDVRAYRERNLSGTGVEPVFPLWKRDTTALAREMIMAGMQAVVVAVDTHVLDAACVGAPYDAAFVHALPDHADACGERGEFHTFVWNGPMMRAPVAWEAKGSFECDHFAWCQVQAPVRQSC